MEIRDRFTVKSPNKGTIKLSTTEWNEMTFITYNLQEGPTSLQRLKKFVLNLAIVWNKLK